jgi:plasmid maintenance system antidote protein VapI
VKPENQLQIVCFNSTTVDNAVQLTERLETTTKEWLNLPATGSLVGRRKYRLIDSVKQIVNFHNAQEIGS